jgi:choline monooxygenase
MRCQYHGWEFQQDGRTGKIPEPKNFVPFDVHPCLDRYQVESVGQLLFVNLDRTAPSLRAYFGDDYYAMLDERFGHEWQVRLDWELEYAANWKIPIENSLEAYHVPAVHPKTFQVDPGDARSQHELLDNRTSFSTTLPFAPHSRIQATLQRMDARVTKLLGHEVTNTYSQHHVFPHTMFSFTDVLSLCHAVIPTGPTTSRAVIRQFGRLPKHGRVWKRTFAKAWTAFGSTIAKRIMQEDLGMFANIQNGLRHSPHQGMLGRCEERIHSFQEYVARTVR